MNVLTNEQRSAFDEDGFVVLRGLLDAKTDLDPVIIEYEGVLDRLAFLGESHQLVPENAHAAGDELIVFLASLVGVAYLNTRLAIYGDKLTCLLCFQSERVCWSRGLSHPISLPVTWPSG